MESVADLSTEAKALRIIERIRDIANKADDDEIEVTFTRDWGDNSLTIEITGRGHTHVGGPGDDFTTEILIDSLYDCLCNERGLSWS